MWQFMTEECCTNWMKRPCIWDDTNEEEIQENNEIRARADKRLRLRSPDGWDAICNIPPSSDEEENLVLETFKGDRGQP